MRERTGLDACFIEEDSGGRRTIRTADGPSTVFGIDVDVAIVVPVLLSSGDRAGTLCAVRVDARTDDGDIRMVQLIADLIADEFERDLERLAVAMLPQMDTLARISGFIDLGIGIAYQPIVDLSREALVGFEALARFPEGSPGEIFSDAWTVGLGPELELAAINAAVAGLPALPPAAWLSVNASPSTILSEGFIELLARVPANRLVVEITEHDAISDYGKVTRALEELLDRGVRLAIDDVGVGYSSFEHIMELSPDILKLDVAFTRDIDRDPMRRAATNALVRFAADIDALVVAEQIETADELRTMLRLGVRYGQGFHVGHPERIDLTSI